MNFRKVLAHPLFQYSLELLIPVLGYLFFGWTLPVIIAFYFFDFLGAEFARHRRHKKVMEVNSAAEESVWTTGVIVSAMVFVLTVTLALFLMADMVGVSGAKPMVEIIEFLKEEGWLLLPLVLFAAHLKDKMTFYMPKKYYDYSFDKLMKNFYLEIVVLLLLISVGLVGYYYLSSKLDGLILLAIFILIKLIFDFRLVKPLNEKAKA